VALADPDVEDVQSFGEQLHLRVSNPSGPLARLPKALESAGVKLNDLKPVEPTLEDVFIHLLETTRHGDQPPDGD
jgi:hypothetical protein